MTAQAQLHACEESARVRGRFVQRVAIAAVSAEEFVAAVARKRNGHELAREALSLGAAKLPIKTKFVTRLGLEA